MLIVRQSDARWCERSKISHLEKFSPTRLVKYGICQVGETVWGIIAGVIVGAIVGIIGGAVGEIITGEIAGDVCGAIAEAEDRDIVGTIGRAVCGFIVCAAVGFVAGSCLWNNCMNCMSSCRICCWCCFGANVGAFVVAILHAEI